VSRPLRFCKKWRMFVAAEFCQPSLPPIRSARRSLPVSTRVVGHLLGPATVVLDNSSTHKGAPLQQLLRNIAAYIASTFPPMLRSSTPVKGVGPWRNERSPIVAPMMWRSWLRTSSARSTRFVPQLRNCAAAYCSPDCLFFCARLLHRLCRDQGFAGGGGSDISVGAGLGVSV
jgi:hypothetical protein